MDPYSRLRIQLRFAHLLSIVIILAVSEAILPRGVFADILEGGEIRLGSIAVHPAIGLETGYNDNVYRSNNNKQSSAFVVVSPEVGFSAQSGVNIYSLKYNWAYGRFNNASKNNFSDHRFLGAAHWEFNTRNRLDLEGEYVWLHDPIGTDRTQGGEDGDPDQQADKWRGPRAGVVYGFGGPQAKGRVEFRSDYLRKRYTNNREQTRFLDRRQGTVGGTFFWRVKPRTSLLFDASATRFNYDEGQLDSNQQAYRAGVEWTATAKTSGRAEFGFQRKNFDQSGIGTSSGPSWLVGVQWAPRTYSIFDFTTSKQFQEATSSGAAQNVTQVGVQWTHEWNNRFSTVGDASYAQTSYINSGRDDDYYVLGLTANYQMRRWLTVGAGYTYDDRDSNQSEFNYKRNVARAFIRAQF